MTIEDGNEDSTLTDICFPSTKGGEFIQLLAQDYGRFAW